MATKKKQTKPILVVDYSRVILPCTRKFIEKNKLPGLKKELADLNVAHSGGGKVLVGHDSPTDSSNELNLTLQIRRYEELLRRKDFLPTGNKMVQIGNGVELLIDHTIRRTVFFDNAAEGNKKNILTDSSPLGKLINKKNVGFKGDFNCNAEATHKVEILKILSYPEAKKILRKETGNGKT